MTETKMASLLKGLRSMRSHRSVTLFKGSKIAAQPVAFRHVSGSSDDLVLTERMGDIFMIAINRPSKRNCVSPATAQMLIKAFKQFESEDDAKVAVLYGKGGVFCAGFDLKALAGMDATSASSFAKEPVQGLEAPMGPSRMLVSKPVIAAVEGFAVAGGLELACLCDLRVVDESAIMGIFCRRFGVPLIDGGTIRLPKLIGLSRALDLILTGRPVTAKEALEYGLANRVAATGTAVGEAVQLAKQIARFPQECMRIDRRSAYYSSFDAKNITDAFQFEFENGMKVISVESVQGASTFVKGTGRHGDFSNIGRNIKSKL